jgi:hypothetical protein
MLNQRTSPRRKMVLPVKVTLDTVNHLAHTVDITHTGGTPRWPVSLEPQNNFWGVDLSDQEHKTRLCPRRSRFQFVGDSQVNLEFGVQKRALRSSNGNSKRVRRKLPHQRCTIGKLASKCRSLGACDCATMLFYLCVSSNRSAISG